MRLPTISVTKLRVTGFLRTKLARVIGTARAPVKRFDAKRLDLVNFEFICEAGAKAKGLPQRPRAAMPINPMVCSRILDLLSGQPGKAACSRSLYNCQRRNSFHSAALTIR